MKTVPSTGAWVQENPSSMGTGPSPETWVQGHPLEHEQPTGHTAEEKQPSLPKKPSTAFSSLAWVHEFFPICDRMLTGLILGRSTAAQYLP